MTVAVISVLDLVEARLKLITTTNGYNTGLKSIKRAKLTPFKGHDLPAINYWSTGIENVIDEYGKDARSIPLFVEYHTTTRDDAFLDTVSELAADIVTAINRATTKPKVADGPSYNLGDKVSDVIFEGYDHEIGEGQTPWCGVLVRFRIVFSTDIFDMASYAQ